MSVEVLYNGRLGNNIFQYVCGRLLAEENGLALETAFREPWAFEVSLPRPGERLKGHGPPIRIGDPDRVLERPWPKAHYVLDGFFQEAGWYYARKEKVLSFLKRPAVQPLPLDHVVACVRLGDYRSHRIAIHPSWYADLLKQLRPGKVTVVTDSPGDPYHRVFSSYNPEIKSSGILEDFDFIRRARALILSNSTFSWWAAFMGHAQSVYTFTRWIGNPAAQLSGFPGAITVAGRFEHEC